MEPLEKLFNLQKGLLEHYIKLESLPSYPLDINEKATQKLIRSFIGRITEEVAEAYQELELTYKHASINQPNEANLHLDDAKEEIGDCLHFLLETLLYCNIDSYKISILLDRVYGNHTVESYDVLDNSLTIAALEIFNNPMITIARKGFWVQDKQFSIENLANSKVLMFDIIYKFNLAANQLKIKEWSQDHTEKKVNEMIFEERMIEGYISFFCFLALMGIEKETIMEIYEAKNKKNHQRILNGY